MQHSITKAYKISIAICTYNRCRYLRDTLNYLQHQKGTVEHVEVLVIDNNSTDETQDVILQFGRTSTIDFRSLKETTQGLSFARNRALHESQSEYVLYIDDDVILGENFIQNWLDFLDRNPLIVGGGGPIEVHFDEGQPTWFPMVLRQMLGHHSPYAREREYHGSEYPHGGNMLVHRETALKLHGFNTALGRIGTGLGGGEEKDFFKRLAQADTAIIFNPGATLKHRIGPERLSKEYFLKQAEGIGSGERLIRRGWIRFTTGLAIQGVKLAGSLVISAGYLLRFRAQSALSLLQFRIRVLKGYITG